MMQQPYLWNFRQAISILLLVVAGIFALFAWQSHSGLSLSDEGFLWYGVQRVMVGEVPMRDFMAYDIGRYYWSATIMSLSGDNGIVALRVTTAIFQAIALFIGLAVLFRNSAKQNLLFWLLAFITLLAWTAPTYRMFDISLPIILVGVLSYLIEYPSNRRYFLVGLVVGVAAVFGRNHGIYGVLGSLGAMTYFSIKRDVTQNLYEALKFWVLGIIVGYLPVLMFIVIVPGFAHAFWNSILLLFEVKATNIPLPVPWPWRVSFGELSVFEMLRDVMQGIFFIAIVVFGLLGIVWSVRGRLRSNPAAPLLTASILLAIPYAHYAYSRADMEHLAPAISPFLIGILVLLAGQPAKIKWFFAVLLCGTSILVTLPLHGGWQCFYSRQCVDTKIGEDQLKVDLATARNLSAIKNLAQQFSPGNHTFVTTPVWPGIYAVLGRKSPMWEIYALFPRSVAFQQSEIERIKAASPGFVVVYDFPIDGREELRFRNTHSLINQYIRENFELLNEYSYPMIYTYRSKEAGQ